MKVSTYYIFFQSKRSAEQSLSFEKFTTAYPLYKTTCFAEQENFASWDAPPHKALTVKRLLSMFPKLRGSCEISGSHGGEHENSFLLDCWAV
jgi:hypothetical protein